MKNLMKIESSRRNLEGVGVTKPTPLSPKKEESDNCNFGVKSKLNEIRFGSPF